MNLTAEATRFGLRTTLLPIIVGVLLGAAYLASAAELPAGIDVLEENVVAADLQWTTVDVHLPEASRIAFTATNRDGAVIFEWTRMIDGDYRFEWRGRSTDGEAAPDGKYTLAITGGGLDELVDVKVKNKVKGDDGDGAPGPPGGLAVAAGNVNHITWEKTVAVDAVAYKVYAASSADGPWTLEAGRAPESLDSTPAAREIVWYRIAAVDLHGNEGPMSEPVSSDHVVMSQTIGPEGGVIFPTTGTIRLEIPPGAVESPVEFTIEQVPTPPEANVNRVMVTRGFEITPHGTVFDPPASLMLRYEIPAEFVLPTGYPEETTMIQYWTDDHWETVRNSAVDRDMQTITVPLDHLSLYQGASATSPHGGYGDGTNFCTQCHTVHASPSPTDLYKHPTQKETCYQCHDGTGASTDIRGAFGESVIGASTKTSFHPVPTDSLACGDCHTPHKLAAEYTKLLRVWDGGAWNYSEAASPIGNDYCYACHGSTSTYPDPLGDQAAFQGGVHNLHGGFPESGSEVQCVLCHDPHGSDHADLSNQEDTCFACHSTATPNTNPDYPFTDTNVEYAFTAAANDYGSTFRIYHHPIETTEQDGGSRQIECASCHNSHVVDRDYSGSTSKLSNPGDTRLDWIVTWTDPTYRTRGDINDFCVACHQEPTATAPFSAGTWVPYDVRLVNDSGINNGGGKPHDGFRADAYAGQAHGELACTACHDPHGSSNAYMFRERVIASGGVVDNNSEPGKPAGTVSPAITGYDDTYPAGYGILESFCVGCHVDNYHNVKGSLCTGCHFHGAGKF
ncbi:MAG: cytochrome c3 family protein [Actinomycetota bacterium]